MDERSSQPQLEIALEPAELDLIRTALGHLEATLGREEAEQLEAVQQLIAKIERART